MKIKEILELCEEKWEGVLEGIKSKAQTYEQLHKKSKEYFAFLEEEILFCGEERPILLLEDVKVTLPNHCRSCGSDKIELKIYLTRGELQGITVTDYHCSAEEEVEFE